MTTDQIVGALLGTAVGDALGMPIEGLSHQNVRTYYKGIKEYRDDDQRGDLDAGQWTDDTQFTFAVARAFVEAESLSEWPARAAERFVALRDEARRWGTTTQSAVERLADGASWQEAGNPDRPTDGAAMRAAPLGAWWAASEYDQAEAWPVIRDVLGVTHRHPAALAAGFGQAHAVRAALQGDLTQDRRDDFWSDLIDAVVWAEEQAGDDSRVSDRLKKLQWHLEEFPLDLRDLCGSVNSDADQAWPYAMAMVARAPHLVENTLLSGINVGGDADTIGAMMGAVLGARHGWTEFPEEWHEGLEAREELEQEAHAFAEAIRG